MVRTDGAHRAGGDEKRGRKAGVATAVILVLVALALLAFFWLFDVDVRVRGDIEAPDVDVEGGDVELPEVDLDPAGETDG